MKYRLRMGQKGGVGVVTAIVFLMLALPIVLGTLSLSSTLSIDSRIKTAKLKSQYAAIGGNQYAQYQLVYVPGFALGLEEGTTNTATVTLNGQDVDVAITKIINPNFAPQPPHADNSRRLQTTKTVAPATVAPDVLTTFNYTIMVENKDDQSNQLTHIYDVLPPGFTYVPDSTYSVSNYRLDPAISGQTLTWNMNSLHMILLTGESITLEFQARATLAAGVYCNEAWVDRGGTLTSSGKTAKVTVGTPSSTLCSGASVRLSKSVTPSAVMGGAATTYTYVVSLANEGTTQITANTSNGWTIRDLLPPGLTYVAGSTSGVTSLNPSITTVSNDGPARSRLDWDPSFTLLPGETKTLTFQATATLDPGDYYNEVWMSVNEISDNLYSWPTALVRVMGVFSAQSSSGSSQVDSNIWLGDNSAYSIGDWTIQ